MDEIRVMIFIGELIEQGLWLFTESKKEKYRSEQNIENCKKLSIVFCLLPIFLLTLGSEDGYIAPA